MMWIFECTSNFPESSLNLNLSHIRQQTVNKHHFVNTNISNPIEIVRQYKNFCIVSFWTPIEMNRKITYCLLSLTLPLCVVAGLDLEAPLQSEYNPCCSMPCHHRGVCTPISGLQFECDCVKGYYGKTCDKTTLSQWILDYFKLNQITKQKLALTGKLIWAIVNNIPVLHDTALRFVYMSGSDAAGLTNPMWNFDHEYTTLDVYYNQSLSVRGLPPVPYECPTPLGVKGPKDLPDVEKVFEVLFRRREFKPCPYGTNLMFATFAQQLSYQLFRTDSKDFGIMYGSNGADVSQIYGPDEATRRALRSMSNGKLKTRIINGEQYPPYLEDAPGVTMVYPEERDTRNKAKKVFPKWAVGHRLSSMSPLMFAVATIWLREHNRVCDIMVKEHPEWNDERIYQTVRWIILGELLTITGGEYLQHLAQFRLRLGYKPQLMHDLPVRFSNQMQYEFNLISQWHQTMPDIFSVQGKDYNLSSLLFSNNRIIFEHGLDAIVDAMSRNPAGQITYQNSGTNVKSAIQKLIMEGRKTRLRSLNDYRRFFDMKPYQSFMELIGDSEMAHSMQELYGDIDAVEFFVGIFLERHLGSIVPPTMFFLAGPMALKGIMGNPIGSSALWRPSTFGGKIGFDTVQKASLRKLFCLNLKGNCKNNVWVSFRTPGDITASSRRKSQIHKRKNK